MDLLCLFLVSARAMMVGCSWACKRDCRSIMVACMPLVLRVRTVMLGWVKGAGSLCFGGTNSEGGEEHMHAATPVISLPRRAFEDDGWVLGV